MEVYRKVNAFDYMELLIDYTAEKRNPDPRIVETEPQRIDLIIYTNPLLSGME